MFAFVVAAPASLLLVDALTRGDRAVLTYSAEDVAETPVTSPSGRLRVGAYNIAHGRGSVADSSNFSDASERKERLEAIGALLREQRLDVVVLNEVDFDSLWSAGENQAALLAKHAGLRYRVEQRNFDVGALGVGLRFGNAILSRFPLKECRLLDYPAYRGVEAVVVGKKRGVVCDVETPDGGVRVVAVHLSHRSEEVRLRAAEMLASLIDDEGLPVIAAGDFNSAPPMFPRASSVGGRTAISFLLERGYDAPAASPPVDERLTFPTEGPDRVLDWVLVGPPLKLTSLQVLREPHSDHLPLIAEVTLPAEIGDGASSR